MKRRLTPEDLVAYEWLEGVAFAPSGRHLAYLVRRIVAGAYQATLVLRDADGRETPLTGPGERAASPTFTRESDRLLFVRHRGAAWDLVIVDLATLTQRTLSAPGAPPTALDVAPGGRRLACVRATPAPPLPRVTPSLPPPDVRVITRLRYKQDGAGFVANTYRQIWEVDLASGVFTQRTSAERDHGEPRFSHAGDRIACVALAREQNEPLGYGQIAILPDDGPPTLALPGWPGAMASPVWRADDQAIAFAGHDFPPPVHRRRFAHVWLLDLASGTATDLSAALDAQVGNYAVSDMRPGLTSVTLAWPGGRGDLTCLLTLRGAVHLYRIDPERGTLRALVGGEGVVFSFAVADDGSVVYGRSTAQVVGDLFLWQGGVSRRLAAFNAWLADVALAEVTAREFVGPGGVPVHAFTVTPPGPAPERGRPAVIAVHCSMFSFAFSHEWQVLAAAGYLVSAANQFGTTAGYGQAHALGNYIGSQERECAEILAVVDALPGVDPARVGVTGGSCGGFLTNHLIGHTERFAAAVTQRSISDLVSKFGTGDNGPEQATAEGAMPPWMDVHTLWRHSPLAAAPRVRTPTLILHAADDHRCPLPQAEAWFAALRWHGVPVEMIVFEGESHDLTRSGRPENRLYHLERMIDWFDRHLHP